MPQHHGGSLLRWQQVQRADQRVTQVDGRGQVWFGRRLTAAEHGQLAAPPLLPSPPVGPEVVQGPPEVALGVALDSPALPEQPFQRGLHQVLTVLAAAGQQDGRPHELGTALGQEQLEGVGFRSLGHASTSFSRLPSTKERHGELTYSVSVE